LSSKADKLKLLVIGLDGATFNIINPLINKGVLPNLKYLIDNGCSGVLKSTIPPLSPPAWITFLTGSNPAKHGIFGFRTYDLSKYTCFAEKFITSKSYAGNTIVDILGNAYRIASLSVPMTFPPWEINGHMISGFPAPDFKIYSYPPELNRELGIKVLSASGNYHTKSTSKKMRLTFEILKNRKELALKYLKSNEYDVIFIVFNNTDDVNHHFLRFIDKTNPHYTDSEHKRYGNTVEQIYMKCDEAIGEFFEYLSDDCIIMIMSDHGGEPTPKKYFNTNRWLKEIKLLEMKEDAFSSFHSFRRKTVFYLKDHIPFKENIRRILPEKMLAKMSASIQNTNLINWNKTYAYRVPMIYPFDGININLLGRQSLGIVKDEKEYEETRAFIIKKIESLNQLNDFKIVDKVYKKEEIYNGQYLNNAPDLVLHLCDGIMGGNYLDKEIISLVESSYLKVWGGIHNMNGIFISTGSSIKQGVEIKDAKIADIAPTILYSLKMSIPDYMDGNVLKGIFTKEFTQNNPIIRKKAEYISKDKSYALAEEEEKKMKENLKGMGYL